MTDAYAFDTWRLAAPDYPDDEDDSYDPDLAYDRAREDRDERLEDET